MEFLWVWAPFAVRIRKRRRSPDDQITRSPDKKGLPRREPFPPPPTSYLCGAGTISASLGSLRTLANSASL